MCPPSNGLCAWVIPNWESRCCGSCLGVCAMPRMRDSRPGLSISRTVVIPRKVSSYRALRTWSGLFYRLVAGSYHPRRQNVCLGISPRFRSKRVAVDPSSGYDSPDIQSFKKTNSRTMHHTPVVSVIVIFFNAEQFFEEAIQSVFDQ